MKTPLRARGLTVPCRWPHQGLFVLLVFLLEGFTPAAAQPTLSTDLPDYPPGATVTLTGTGFAPGDSVEMQVLHEDGDALGSDPQYHQPWIVVADESGGFITYWTVPLDGDAEWATLLATANGLTSGLHAEVTFTDAPKCNLSITPLSVRCASGGSVQYTVTAANNVGGFSWTVSGGGSISGSTTASTITVNWAASSNNSESVSVTTSSACEGTSLTLPVGLAPAATSATALPGSNATTTSIKANWNPSNNVTKYLLDWSTDIAFGTFTTINAGTSTSGTISGLSAGTTYYYRVRAANDCNTASPSLVITYGTLPAAPVAASASPVGCQDATVGWSSVAGAAGYYIDVASNSNFTSNAFVGRYKDSAVGAVTSFVISGLTPGASYFYRVRARNAGNEFGAYSGTVPFTMQPAAPGQPGQISGDATVCSGATGKVYSVAAVTNATGYSWTLPTGAVIATGAGQNSITVDFGSNAGTISVAATNSCGSGPVRTLTVAMTTVPSISGQPQLQSIIYGSNALYAVTASGAASYQWQEWISSWNNLSNGNGYSGVATANLRIAVPGVAASGRKYRCVVTNSCGSVTTDEAALTVGARPITITADAASKTYGDGDPALTAQVTSGTIVGADAASGALTRAAGEDAGTYAITKGTYTYGSNYAETYVGALLRIDPRPITLTADALPKVYGDPDPAFTAQVTTGNIIGPDMPSGTLGRAPGEDVGTYAISQGTYTYGSNYAETFVGALLTIGQRSITVTVTPGQHKTYGATDPTEFALTLGSNQSLASWDDYIGGLTREPGEGVGSYNILQAGLLIKQGSTDHTANYAITYTGSTFAIDKRPITITADAKSKYYGNGDPALTAQVTTGTIVGTDAATGSLTRASGETVGTYAIDQGTYTYGSNYDETFAGALLTINQRPINVIVTPGQHKMYGATDPAEFALTLGTDQTLAPWDDYIGGLTRQTGENVGAYNILQTGLSIKQGSTDHTANYAITYTGSSFAIDKRPITITADAKTKVYGNSDPAFTAQVTTGTIVGTDAPTGALTRASGEIVGTYAISKGTYTYGSNYDESFVGALLTICRRPLTINVTAGQQKTYGTADPPAFAYSLGASQSLASWDAFSGGLTRDAGENVNTYNILLTGLRIKNGTDDNTAYYNITYNGATFAIVPVQVDKYVGVQAPNYRQYSDSLTVSARIEDGAPRISGQPGAAGSVTFKIGTQELGTVLFTDNGSGDLTATLCAPLLETVAGQMAPGTKTITAVFNSPNANYGLNLQNNFATDNTFCIRKEDARVEYTGDQIMSTGSPTSLTATVKLRATIYDISAMTADPAYDRAPGDIRKAKVRFVNRETGAFLSDWIQVVLVASDCKVGTVSANLSITLGSTETDREIVVGIVVDGYYNRDCTADNTVVTVYKPVGDFITGGGHVVPDKSVGTYKSDVNTKTNFGFNVKYTKKGTNLQGNMNIVFRRTESDGLHTYQIKANSLLSLGVNASNPALQTAQFSSKANLTDVTNPLAPVPKGGNKTLYVTMTDRGDPGSADSISFVLVEGSADPGVLANIVYSSEWVSNRNGQKGLRGGNLVVKSGFSLSTSSSTIVSGRTTAGDLATTAESLAKGDAPAARFDLTAYPNHTQTQFNLLLQSDDTRAPILLRIFDLNGRLVQQFASLTAGQLLQVGSGYAQGTYVAEMIQGTKRATVKLIKE